MSPKQKERLVLLDAHAIIHRAYHALPDFATSRGEPTGALYGLVLMILKIASELKPDYLVACYDLPKPTYRHEVYEVIEVRRNWLWKQNPVGQTNHEFFLIITISHQIIPDFDHLVSQGI